MENGSLVCAWCVSFPQVTTFFRRRRRRRRRHPGADELALFLSRESNHVVVWLAGGQSNLRWRQRSPGRPKRERAKHPNTVLSSCFLSVSRSPVTHPAGLPFAWPSLLLAPAARGPQESIPKCLAQRHESSSFSSSLLVVILTPVGAVIGTAAISRGRRATLLEWEHLARGGPFWEIPSMPATT